MKLPTHPEPHTYQWTALELRTIEEYGDARAKQALAATAVIEPVAASIDGPAFGSACMGMAEAKSNTDYSFHRSKLVEAIDQHCAAQVAQAESAARHEAQSADEWRARAMKAEEYITLKEAPFGPEWQIYRVGVADGKVQALTAKPAPSELTSADIIAAVDAAHARGRIALTHINNDGEEVPTDIAKCFTRALLSR